MFIVDALGVPQPAGGWNQRNTLEYLQSEYGLTNSFGWNPSAPLCAETFEEALRQILTKAQASAAPGRSPGSQPTPSSANSKPGDKSQASAANNAAPGTIAQSGQTGRQAANSAGSSRPTAVPENKKIVEDFISEVKRSGMLPADKCALVPTLQLKTLQFAPNCPTLPCSTPVSTPR